ncbi:hypothetical protein FRC00_013264 [Tulasnella sp. 408]|nr:hypothetical protein FRC00_013264 [Tulasnella sp. 408]
MPPKGAGKEKAGIEEEDEILQAVILADSFNSRFGPLTMDLPRCLLPVCNTPLLDWTFEALASAGVQQVYVFCSSHAGLIRQAIDASPWSRPSSGLRIIPISSREARSVGDALREIDTKQIISSDFVLVSGDIISNIRIDEVVKEHRERRKISKDAIMTTVVREVGPRDRPQPGGDATVIVMNAETSQCVHYEYIQHDKTDFDLPAEVITKHRDLDVRIDLLDCGIDICSPDVPALFSENFDYQDLRKDFVRGVLTSDLLSKTIYCHVATTGYAARVKNTRSYAAISKDIITRRTFPLVPDDNHLGGDRFDQRRGYVYVSKNRVSLSRTCVIGNHTIVGAGCEVMNDVHISSSVLGKGCEIGNRTTIRNSFIWDKTRIGADCIIEESIIGAHVRVLDGSVIRRGCLVGQHVTLGPNATLDKFQRVSRHPPAANEDEDWDEEEEQPKEEVEKEDDDDETDEDKSDHGSDVEYEESDVSDLDTVGSSPMGSPLSASSATSAGLINNIPSMSLDSSADFMSECRQSLDRAYQEGHSIDNAAIELKTLRMASNVPLKQVAESIVGFLVGKIELVDNPAAQRGKVNAVVGRWGPLLTSIGWDDAAETISLLQRYCALNDKYQKIFGLVLASFYNEDIAEFDDIKSWYGRNLALKKQGLDPKDPIGAVLEDTMQQAMKLIQQIHALEQEDDDEEESDDDEEESKPQPSGRTAPPSAGKAQAESDDDSEGEEVVGKAATPANPRSAAKDDDDDEGEATETEDEK